MKITTTLDNIDTIQNEMGEQAERLPWLARTRVTPAEACQYIDELIDDEIVPREKRHKALRGGWSDYGLAKVTWSAVDFPDD